MLRRDILAVHRRILGNDGKGPAAEALVVELEVLQRQVHTAKESGSLDQHTALTAAAVAQNILIYTQFGEELERLSESELKRLSRTFDQLLRDESRRQRPTLHVGTRKRDYTPSPTTSVSPCRLASPPSSTATSPNTFSADLPINSSDHLRLWFLENLSKPYPTPSQKAEIAERANIPRNKIDSDMTNWRRRAGWTEIKDRWCKKDKERMRVLIERYDMGLEDRPEVLEAIEKMKAYLTKEKENSVGSWIETLKSTKDAHTGKRKKPRTSASSVDSIVDKPSLSTTPLRSAKTTRSTASSAVAPSSERSVSGSSLRSISSSFSSSSSAAGRTPSFNFKPYVFTPSSSAPSTVASSPETVILGKKRFNEAISHTDTPNTRLKTETIAAHNVEVEWVPQYTHTGGQIGLGMPSAMPSLLPMYDQVVYTTPHPLGAVEWSTGQPMPAHLPHMEMGYHQQINGEFKIPTKHEFSFAMPVVEHAYRS